VPQQSRNPSSCASSFFFFFCVFVFEKRHHSILQQRATSRRSRQTTTFQGDTWKDDERNALRLSPSFSSRIVVGVGVVFKKASFCCCNTIQTRLNTVRVTVVAVWPVVTRPLLSCCFFRIKVSVVCQDKMLQYDDSAFYFFALSTMSFYLIPCESDRCCF
jgi:hypothetical protein